MSYGRRPNPTSLAVEAASKKSDPSIRTSEEDGASSIILRGNEVTFFPSFERVKEIANQHADELEADGWVKSDEQPTALDFIVRVMRGDERSRKASALAKSFGKDAPIVCPKEFVVAHDISGRQRRSCDLYVCRQTSLPTGSRRATEDAVDAAKKWFGSDTYVTGRGVELPDPPWQRVAQIDEIWYLRRAVEGLGARYEHPYRPSVPLYVSARPRGWRIALPDGCIVDERGFVVP